MYTYGETLMYTCKVTFTVHVYLNYNCTHDVHLYSKNRFENIWKTCDFVLFESTNIHRSVATLAT